jgi:GDPmannose 4,6-dehydratase
MKKTAIIIGSEGQDGKILFNFLANKNYNIIGIGRTTVRAKGIKWNRQVNINKVKEVFGLIEKVKPDEVYHLAAFHHSSQDKAMDDLTLLRRSYQVHFFSLAYFLEAARRYSPTTRVFYAASSLVFGSAASGRQTESTSFSPDSFYGLSKLDGLLLCRMYRQKYGLFTAVGIFYNHESAYRSEKFISRKIIQGAIDIKNKKKDSIKVGNLQAEVDWGYAPDYMEAAHQIIRSSIPDDFIVATGKKHTVLDLVKVVFGYFDLDWKKYIVEDKNIIHRKRNSMVGDVRKLTKQTGWKPSVGFDEMVVCIIKQLDK